MAFRRLRKREIVSSYNTFDGSASSGSSPVGSLNVLLLRRIAFNMLALFRSVTQRAEDKRGTPWLTLFNRLYIALVSATAEAVAGLRTRVSTAS